MTFFLIISHCEEGDDDCNPIEVVREDRAVSCTVFPTEEGVEDSPSSATVNLGIAALFSFVSDVNLIEGHDSRLGLLTLTCQTL